LRPFLGDFSSHVAWDMRCDTDSLPVPVLSLPSRRSEFIGSRAQHLNSKPMRCDICYCRRVTFVRLQHRYCIVVVIECLYETKLPTQNSAVTLKYRKRGLRGVHTGPHSFNDRPPRGDSNQERKHRGEPEKHSFKDRPPRGVSNQERKHRGEPEKHSFNDRPPRGVSNQERKHRGEPEKQK
jgi:hypothetical protein